MGKTSKALNILVTDQALYDTPEVQELASKGHVVHPPGDVLGVYDVIIGPTCWRIIPAMGKLGMYLKMMLAGVRSVKYPKVSKKDTLD